MSATYIPQQAKDIYFAGPLFSEAELAFNLSIVERLEHDLGVTVFLPQRDGLKTLDLMARGLSKEAAQEQVFLLDEWHIAYCHAFVVCLDGNSPDPGTCLEIGMAITCQRFTQHPAILVGLKTGRLTQPLGAMVEHAVRPIVTSYQELSRFLRKELPQHMIEPA